MGFEIASSNLVVDLGIIMALVPGGQFTAGEFVGGPMMIWIVVVLFRRFRAPRLLQQRVSRPTAGCWAPWKATPRWTCRSSAGERFSSGSSRVRASMQPPRTS
jgi:hypothetical protein